MHRIVLVLLFFPLLSFAQGINFLKTSWEETLIMAEDQNKIIFVDAYTSWCAPCRMMASKIFPKKSIGDFYNQHFINVKIDMERGEGPVLANQYDVKAYPTFLFIDSEGNLLHSSLGYKEASAFIELGREALDPAKQLHVLRNKYNQGERTPSFLKTFSIALNNISDNMSDRVALQYLNTLESWENEETLAYLIPFCKDPDAPLGKYFLENTDLFSHLLGRETTKTARSNMAYYQLSQKGYQWEKEEAETVLSVILGEENIPLQKELMLQYFVQKDQYELAVLYVLKNFKAEARGNLIKSKELASFVLDNSQNSQSLKKALKILKGESKNHPQDLEAKDLETAIKAKVKSIKQNTR